MRSKTSYFNPTLFKKNLARFWPLWGGASFIGALFPLYLLALLIHEGRPLLDSRLEATSLYYDALIYAVPAVSLVYGALCALAVWGWLYNTRSVGMYHSLPITRKGLFATSLLSGLSMMLIPYAVTGALTILVSLAAGVFEPVGLLVTILGVLGDTFFYFATATLVVFVTGNPFAFAAFYFIFHFLAAFAEWLVSRLMTAFYFGVEAAYGGVVEFLSPTMYLTRMLSVYTESEEIVMPDGWVDRGRILSVTLVNGWLIAVYALAGAVLLAAAWALYRRRRSESAGEVVAVGWMKPIFRYGVAFCAAIAGGSLLYTLFCRDIFQTGTTASTVPMAVCMAVAGVLGYYIASMLLAKSLQVFRGSAKGVLGTAVAAVAVCCLIAADPWGVEAWVPDAGELESVTARLYGIHGGAASATLEDPAGIQKILDAQAAVIAERDALERIWGSGLHRSTAQLQLTFRLKEGRSSAVYRYYDIPVSEGEQPEAVQVLAALAADPAFQESSIFQGITVQSRRNLREARLTGGYVASLYNPETQSYEGLDLTLEQAGALEEAVRRDIQAGNFGRTLFLVSGEEYDRAVSDLHIQLNYALELQDSGPNRDSYVQNETISIGLSTYCTETLKALEDLGVLNEGRKLLTHAEQYALESGEAGVPFEGDYDPNSFPRSGSVVYPGDAYVYPGEEVDAALLH